MKYVYTFIIRLLMKQSYWKMIYKCLQISLGECIATQVVELSFSSGLVLMLNYKDVLFCCPQLFQPDISFVKRR